MRAGPRDASAFLKDRCLFVRIYAEDKMERTVETQNDRS
jgi:hypothetical protein